MLGQMSKPKPDISLATNTGHLHLLTTSGLVLALERLRVGGEVGADSGWGGFEEVGAVEGTFDEIAIGFAGGVSELRGYVAALGRVDVEDLHCRAARVIESLHVDPLDLRALQRAEVDAAALLTVN